MVGPVDEETTVALSVDGRKKVDNRDGGTMDTQVAVEDRLQCSEQDQRGTIRKKKIIVTEN